MKNIVIKSYGIICIKKFDSVYKILMVKKPVSYYFIEFITGNYEINNNKKLLKLFNGMTHTEKTIIKTHKYDLIWFFYRNEIPTGKGHPLYNIYVSSKNKFNKLSVEKIDMLLQSSYNTETIWEFPKGRKNLKTDACNVITAMREFEEETGIKKDEYKMIFIPPYIESFQDLKIKYINTYYYAECISNFVPHNKFIYKNEMSEIKWVCNNEIIGMSMPVPNKVRLQKLFKKICNKYKNYKD